MRKQVLRKTSLFLIANFFFLCNIYAASDGTNGTVTPVFLPENHVTVGESVKLTIAVSKMTDGGEGKSKGDCVYSIEIPAELIQTEEGTAPSPNDLTDAGDAGNGNYYYGAYTSNIPGSHLFKVNVTTGTKDTAADSIAVFHPAAPVAQAGTALSLYGFTAMWEPGLGAESYIVTVVKDGQVEKEIENITATSQEITGLTPATTYKYVVKSKAGELLSLVASDSIDVTTKRPVLSLATPPQPFAAVLGTPAKQTVTVEVVDLLGDIELGLKGNTVFSINKQTIGETDENRTLEISYNPENTGTHKDTLVLNSIYAEELKIPLIGSAIPPAPVAIDATNPKGSGFTANWNEVSSAESYILTVRDNFGTVVYGYDNLSVGNVTSYEVTSLFPESSYSYTVKAVSNSMVSEESNSVQANTIEGAVIITTQAPVFENEINTSNEKTLRIIGSNLTDKITLSLPENDYFSIDKEEVSAEGGAVVITYLPTEIGTHTVDLTLSSAPAENTVVKLTGKGLPLKTTVLPATDITEASFTANWAVAANASDYLLTVKQGVETILEDQSTAGNNSFAVTELTAGKTYTYTVKVIENETVSLPSEAMNATTHSAPQPVASPEKTALRVQWPALPGAEGYKVSLFLAEAAVEGYDGLVITENTVTFSNLTAATEYQYEIASIFGTNEYSTGKIAVTTSNDYGAQIDNMGFELWDDAGTSKEEPANWNSFMTAGGNYAAFVKKQKVKLSTDVRPESKGTKSASIWSTIEASIVANGNLTTGQIIAGAMSATDLGNHNITQIGNDEFSQKFTGYPDSLTVWAKYVPIVPEGNRARVSAVIHDDFAYREPNGDNPLVEKYVVAKAAMNYEATDTLGWQRLSIPFEYTTNNVKPKYIMVTYTSNENAGGGSENDMIYIDDMLMVYKPTLSIGTPAKTKFAAGEAITVPYTLTGTMSASNLNAAPNVVYLELSDENGSYATPTRIAELTTDQSGELTATLSNNLVPSDKYRVRIVTTNYPMVSEEDIEIEIRQKPAAPVALEADNVTAGSFTARWEAVEGATGYIVTVGDKETTVGAEATTLDVKNLSPETTYSYTVKALKDYMVSDISNSITVKTDNGIVIQYSGESGLATNKDVETTSTLSITGSGLIAGISIEMSENTSGYFSIDKNSMPATGGDLVVTYHPATIGTHTAKLLLSSSFADPITIDLSGTATPIAVSASEAEEVTPVSFKAVWESSDEAEAYLLTVLNSEGEALTGYNDLNVGTETSYTIPDLTPASAYSYSVKVISQNLQSEVSNSVDVITRNKPVISVNATEKDFLLNINETDTETFTVEGTDLFGDGVISIHLSNDAQVKSDKDELNGDGDFVITYSPTLAGTDVVTVTLSTEYADNVTIQINGTARPLAVIALEGKGTTFSSFIASWEASNAVDAYLLTVKDSQGNIVGDYDQKNVGTETSVEITDLMRLRNYTYSVEVKKNDVISLPSNTVTVRTVPGESGVDEVEDTAKIELYPNPAVDNLYIKGAESGAEYAIIDTKGRIVSHGTLVDNVVSVKELKPSAYIIKIGKTSSIFIKK